MMIPGHFWPEGDRGCEALRRVAAADGLRIVSLNMPNVDYNVAALAPEAREYSIGTLERMVRAAGALGASAVVFGPGKPNAFFPAPREELVGHFHAALDRLTPLAETVGTRLLVENLPFASVPDADSMMDALDAHGNERIGICYDVANAHFIGEDLGAGLRRVASRLGLVHASDTTRTHYRHDRIGDGDVPFSVAPPVLAEIGYDEVPVLEVITAEEPDRAIDESVRRLARLGWG
jgi:sugar phosphate isomerase/epimerase